MSPQVMGVDLSLNNTGIAHADGSVEVFTPRYNDSTNAGMDRLCEIRDHIAKATFETLDLVVIEGLAFDAHDTYRWGAQLAGIVRAALYDLGVPFMLCPPGTLKKYATNNGKAGKDQVTNAAQKRLGYDGYQNDEADALWLRAIGLALCDAPPVEMPKVHDDALRLLRQQRPIQRPS
jgi:Holliday junction resolvasome RuvABC endonuclease subunit